MKRITIITGKQGTGKTRLAKTMASAIATEEEIFEFSGTVSINVLKRRILNYKPKVIILDAVSLFEVKPILFNESISEDIKLIFTTQDEVKGTIRREYIEVIKL